MFEKQISSPIKKDTIIIRRQDHYSWGKVPVVGPDFCHKQNFVTETHNMNTLFYPLCHHAAPDLAYPIYLLIFFLKTLPGGQLQSVLFLSAQLKRSHISKMHKQHLSLQHLRSLRKLFNSSELWYNPHVFFLKFKTRHHWAKTLIRPFSL